MTGRLAEVARAVLADMDEWQQDVQAIVGRPPGYEGWKSLEALRAALAEHAAHASTLPTRGECEAAVSVVLALFKRCGVKP
jgi:hypothetical protein